MKIVEMRPPKIAMALVAAAFSLHWLFPVWEGVRFSSSIMGVVVGLFGFVIMIWGWWLFQQGNVAICPTARTEKLIFSGPYRFSRNPMYLGIVTLLLGIAVYMGTPPFFLAVAIYFIILNSVFVPFEEQKLEGAFGSQYIEYKERVRRWL